MALAEDLTSVPRPQMVVHNCLLFQFQGIGHHLMKSEGKSTDSQAGKIPIHIKLK